MQRTNVKKAAVAPKKSTKAVTVTKKRSITTKKASKKIQQQNTISTALNIPPLNTSPLTTFRRKFTSVGEGSDPAFQSQQKTQEKSQTEQEQDDLLQQIDSVVKSYGIVLFMKGTPSEPRCGFSRRVVQILHEFDITFEACNVLESDELREAIKAYSNWPTLPQLYVKGEFVGGCDIITQMYQSGELAEILPLKSKKSDDVKVEEAKTQAV
jgi:monothiol glutaredoxin